MPENLKRYYGGKDLHFITFTCFHRLPLLASARNRNLFLEVLESTRLSYRFVVVGFVVMPEHVHLLLDEPQRANLSAAVKALKQSFSRRIHNMGCPTRADFARVGVTTRFWQARFYDFNVWTEKKRIEKLRYMHRNPVVRGLVQKPEQWHWSSFRHYAYGEVARVQINAIFPPKWARAMAAARQ